METVRIRDGKKSELGSGINILDLQHYPHDWDLEPADLKPGARSN